MLRVVVLLCFVLHSKICQLVIANGQSHIAT
nr:MAG TPA: hypothetical protein [Bacteriophage sp.]